MLDFSDLPKGELHTHLGSSVSSDTLYRLAKQQGIKIGCSSYDEFDELMKIPKHLDHSKYLKKYDITQKVQSSPMAIEESVYQSIELAYKKSNITTLDLRFNPMLRSGDFYDLDDLILYAHIGMLKATAAYPVKVALIISTDRKFDSRKSEILAKKAIKFYERGMVQAFDMSGENKNFNPVDHVNAFKMVKEAGLGITCHIGEGTTDNHLDMSYMLEKYKVDRIGHGTQFIVDYIEKQTTEDIKTILDKNVVLEICPTSNITTNLHSIEMMEVIINKLDQLKIKYCLNSDGALFLNTNVKKEYERYYKFMQDPIDNIERAHSFAFANNFKSQNI